jgi:hypothetical protein
MAVPPKIVGAWRRSGLILDRKRHVDHCDVLWLQTPEWYADIRLRIDPTSTLPGTGASWFYEEFSSAGKAEWDAPVFTWNQVIHIPAEPASVANSLTWADGVIVETGKTEAGGAEAVFSEEWLRMTGDDVRWSADIGDKEARIEVGGYAVEIKDTRAAGGIYSSIRFSKVGGEWVKLGEVTA